MRPLHLADAELAAVMTAASALQPRDRGPFLQEVAAALRAQGDEIAALGMSAFGQSGHLMLTLSFSGFDPDCVRTPPML
jgi:hypothetical protein